MKQQKLSLYLLLAFIAFIATIIFLRNNNLGNSFFNLFVALPYYDKIGHFILMGTLAFLSVIGISPLLPYRNRNSTLVILSVVLSLIALEEFSQIFVATRTFSLLDFLCDLLGVIVFGTIAHYLVHK